MCRRLKIPSKTDQKVTSLENENADLMFQSAIQDMSIQGLQDENADLMLRIAMLEVNIGV